MSAPIEGGAGATSLSCAKDGMLGINNSKSPSVTMIDFSTKNLFLNAIRNLKEYNIKGIMHGKGRPNHLISYSKSISYAYQRTDSSSNYLHILVYSYLFYYKENISIKHSVHLCTRLFFLTDSLSQ